MHWKSNHHYQLWRSNAFNIKNTPKFFKDLNEISIHPNIRLTSFDILNMYANIPIVQHWTENILNWNTAETKQQQNLLKIYDLMINSNNFSQNGALFCLKEGRAMRAPLSVVPSEIFLQHNESIWQKYL